MINPMQWFNAISTRPSLEAAVAEVTERIDSALRSEPDLAIVTISSAYASEYPRLVPLILDRLPVRSLIGCGGAGIVGTDPDNVVREVEENPALSLTAACLDGVEVNPFHISGEALPDLDSSASAWEALVGVSAQDEPDFILLADPFSSRINDLLEGLDFAYPGAAKVGGLSSATAIGMQSGLFYYSARADSKGSLLRQGTVGLALCGNIKVETIVAQGCRPVGPLLQVTKGERNIILEVAIAQQVWAQEAAQTPLAVLQESITKMSEADRELAQNSLFIGLARDEFKLELEQGDFLIRNLIGVDPRIGAIAIGDRVRPGQRVQFHLRDAQTSADDLQWLLERYQKEAGDRPPAIGALQFSCLGRGEALYEEPDFDSQLLRRYLKDLPVGGFFCNGEIGPVGDRTFLHGYTSVFGIVRPKSTSNL